MHPQKGERVKVRMERQGTGTLGHRPRSTDSGGRDPAQHTGKVWAARLLGLDLGSIVPCVCLTPLCLSFLVYKQDSDRPNSEK